MNTSTQVPWTAIVLTAVAVGGIAWTAVGIAVGGPILVVAALLAVAQRSRLAAAARAGGRDRRRTRLVLAGAFGLAFAATLVAYLGDIGDDTVGDTALMVYNVLGMFTLLGTLASLAGALWAPGSAAAELSER